MLQFDEYKVKLNNLLPQLDELEKALNLESAAREVDFLEAQSASDGFWDNPENSQRVLQKLKQLKNKLESQEKRRASWEDMMVLCEMGNEEEDESLLPELEEEYNALIDQLTLETAKMIREDFLQQNAFVEVDSFSNYDRQSRLLAMILDYDRLCRGALEKGADPDALFSLPARAAIGRAKSVPEERYIQAYETIARDMAQQIAQLTEKGGADI